MRLVVVADQHGLCSTNFFESHQGCCRRIFPWLLTWTWPRYLHVYSFDWLHLRISQDFHPCVSRQNELIFPALILRRNLIDLYRLILQRKFLDLCRRQATILWWFGLWLRRSGMSEIHVVAWKNLALLQIDNLNGAHWLISLKVRVVDIHDIALIALVMAQNLNFELNSWLLPRLINRFWHLFQLIVVRLIHLFLLNFSLALFFLFEI